MPTETSREAINAVWRAARAFAAMNEAIAAVEKDIAGFDPFWMAQHANQAYTHYVQGHAYVSTARDGAVPDRVLQHAVAGDLDALEDDLAAYRSQKAGA